MHRRPILNLSSAALGFALLPATAFAQQKSLKE
jgi:hypothetical protein